MRHLPAIFLFLLFILPTLVIAKDHQVKADSDAVELIRELEIRESKQPARDMPGWKAPNKIVVLVPNNRIPTRPDYKEWLQSAVGDTQLVFVKSAEELELEKEDADVYLGFCQHVTEDMETLTWVQNYFVGVDRCANNKTLLKDSVLLTNTSAIPGPGMAEHTIAMMLMLTKKMTIFYNQQQQQIWKRLESPSTQVMEVGDKTMLVVGLGGIGRQIAKRAHGLGMTVKGIRNSSREGPDYVSYVGLADELTKLAAEADVVVNITPLTKSTTGLYDKAFFKTMKPTAYFINMGRGKSVVTEDLLAALQNGDIAGAGVDVTNPEPLPADHPLWKAPNIIITPHNSAPSDQMLERFWILARENLRRYVAGEKMLNVVNLKRGY
ncbi:MAG: D-3-phosphoglycerate dehydrogenase (EC [uncultured Thiotrichaceae bacterium]|uniref:D-3-phosphoglycerate dehydrogenase (EC) n=1 Tax=uncultured Thiotrichaceae bacterium TaxID=298394 RepID=A0A6S6UHH1_9GAMM|nr:MAG: D-3-phosphoglycerate dehydrogenase (EC [uncultured Thiotrichaceae bacterium]